MLGGICMLLLCEDYYRSNKEVEQRGRVMCFWRVKHIIPYAIRTFCSDLNRLRNPDGCSANNRDKNGEGEKAEVAIPFYLLKVEHTPQRCHHTGHHRIDGEGDSL